MPPVHRRSRSSLADRRYARPRPREFKYLSLRARALIESRKAACPAPLAEFPHKD